MFKYLILSFTAIALFTISLHSQELPANPDLRWTQEIEVETGQERFRKETYHAYSVKIWNTDDKRVRKMWESELKDLSEKVKRNVALNAQLPVYAQPVDMHAKQEERRNNDYVTLSAAFLYKGEAINPDNNPEAHRQATDMMHAMAVRMNKAVVEERISEEMDALEKKQKDFQKLEKQQEKLIRSIERDEKRLRRAEKDAKKLERKIRAKENDIEALRESAGDLSEEEQKRLEKARRQLSRLQDQLNRTKNDQRDYRKDIRKAEKALAENKVERRELEAEIDGMERRLTELQQMKLDIE